MHNDGSHRPLSPRIPIKSEIILLTHRELLRTTGLGSALSGILPDFLTSGFSWLQVRPGKWRKFYNGSWDEPRLGGKASYVNAYYVMYNSYLGKYIGLNYGSGITVCTDLSKQDWTPIFKIKGDYWGCKGVWEWHVTDANKVDIFSGGQTLFLYSYFKADGHQVPTQRYRIDFSHGETSDSAGYAPESLFLDPVTCMEPATYYSIEPLHESADRIESRHTRRVHCTSPEMSYSGKWNDEEYTQRIEKAVKACGLRGASRPN
jgi:hypothetical protein